MDYLTASSNSRIPNIVEEMVGDVRIFAREQWRAVDASRSIRIRDGMGFRFTEPFHSGVIVSQTHSHSSSREKCFSPPLLSSSTVSWIAKKPLI